MNTDFYSKEPEAVFAVVNLCVLSDYFSVHSVVLLYPLKGIPSGKGPFWGVSPWRNSTYFPVQPSKIIPVPADNGYGDDLGDVIAMDPLNRSDKFLERGDPGLCNHEILPRPLHDAFPPIQRISPRIDADTRGVPRPEKLLRDR